MKENRKKPKEDKIETTNQTYKIISSPASPVVIQFKINPAFANSVPFHFWGNRLISFFALPASDIPTIPKVR